MAGGEIMGNKTTEEASETTSPTQAYDNFIANYTPEAEKRMAAEIAERTPTEQLSETLFLYNTMVHHLEQASKIEDVNLQMLSSIRRVIMALPEDETTTPIIKLARSLMSPNNFSILKLSHLNRILGDKKWNAFGAVGDTYRWRREVREAQEPLHKDYPFLPNNQLISRIASDAVVTLDDNFNFTGLVNKQGDAASFANPYNNSLGINRDSLDMIKNLHSREMRNIVEHELSVNLSEISLPAQVQLLKFMTEADRGRFGRLCSALHRTDEKVRLKLAEGFLAADFGEDFGDALLDIAESDKIDDEQLGEILDRMNACRRSIHDIAELYHGVDGGGFSREYARAANERLTDTLMVLREIALNGGTGGDLGWFGKTRFDYDAAMEALGYEAKSLEIISGTLSDVAAGEKGAFAEIVMHPDSDNQRLRRTVYNFYSPRHGFVLLYTRPEGSHSFDPMVEYGKIRSRYSMSSANAGVEASISLITDPVAPFLLPSPYKPDFRATNNLRFYDPSTMNKVSAIRLDREGRAPGASADDPNRDPINPIGMVSVDLAAIGDRADTPSGKIARLLSVGGKLREEASGVNSSLNHNTNWFSQNKYGTAEGFRKLVEHIDAMANNWCAEHKPKVDQESFSRLMRQKSRVRGHKAMYVA